jgi:hypothetical protein
MATNMNNLVGSLLTLFNDSSVIPKPNSDYNGSLFFGPNQEVVFRNNAPKGRITPGPTFRDEKGFGNRFLRSKHYNVYVDFMTVDGYTGSSGLKNAELINDYFEMIETAVINNTVRYGAVTLEEMTDELAPDRPDRIEDRGNNVWLGRKLFVFKERK